MFVGEHKISKYFFTNSKESIIVFAFGIYLRIAHVYTHTV